MEIRMNTKALTRTQIVKTRTGPKEITRTAKIKYIERTI